MFDLAKTDQVDSAATSNIHDLAVGQNVAVRFSDPYMTWLPFFTAAMLAIQITFAIKEKMRLIMLLQDFSFYELEKMSRKVKIVILCFLLSVRIMLLAIVVEAALILILLASNPIELLNNTLSVLILDQIDNMGALLLFNWIRTNFNDLTT